MEGADENVIRRSAPNDSGRNPTVMEGADGEYSVRSSKFKVEDVQKANIDPESLNLKTGVVCINKDQYFENVHQEAWNFHIGGYQVLHKWLKDGKDRELSFDDLEHYSKVVTALLETMTLMESIDETIEEFGGFPFN